MSPIPPVFFLFGWLFNLGKKKKKQEKNIMVIMEGAALAHSYVSPKVAGWFGSFI